MGQDGEQGRHDPPHSASNGRARSEPLTLRNAPAPVLYDVSPHDVFSSPCEWQNVQGLPLKNTSQQPYAPRESTPHLCTRSVQ